MAYGGPSDFHNDVEYSNEPPAVFHPPQEQHSVVTTGPVGMPVPVDQSALELAAFEKGRMQGEMEAARRLEAENPKRFNEEVTHTRTTNVLEDVVEVNQLTRAQWAAAIFGELAGLAYIVIMAIWIDQYRRGGVGWDNNDQNGDRGMFNVHILTSFLGLWCAAQAYITYRILPMHMNVIINKLYYVACHVAALACFALSVATATMSQPSTRAWTMHAWTAYLALAIYAAHAIYSSIKVLIHPFGITTSNWNETRNGELYGAAATADAARNHLRATPEQSRDGDLVRPTLYIAGPSVGFWRRHMNEKNLDIDARNANLGAAHGPMWSERATYTAEQFFLVPRAKWGVTALFCLMGTLLVGLGELQMLNALGRDNWTTDVFNQDPMSDFSTDSRLFGVLGLLTMLSTAALGYAAMPPRTTLAKGTTDRVQEMQRRRTSISSAAPSTVQNSRVGYAQPAAIEVV